MTDTLPNLLQRFFHQWLAEQRNASRHTILAYRDAWRLFLRFVADRRCRPVAKLALNDLTAAEVAAFLQHVETGRGASIATRNCRLAALKSFFLFVADREPSAAALCAEVLHIPSKKKAKRAICYLEQEEVAAILAQPDKSTLLGQRDHTLLGFLYNTGARIQEALDVCPKHLRLDSPAHVLLFGKGRKERICPLWPETAGLIVALLRRQPRNPDEPIFCNRYGRKLGASGVRFQLHQYVNAASETMPNLSAKRISPHTFRHYAGFRTIPGDRKTCLWKAC
jgi:site-specific recombinase XerD